MCETKRNTITELSIQTHLEIIQRVIERMAANSSSSKAWCITLVSALLVVVADKSKPDYALLALIPTFLFFALDVYYLALEKGFRNSYNQFILKVHNGKLSASDFYSISPAGKTTTLQIEAISSFSIWGFYFVLVILIILAWKTILE